MFKVYQVKWGPKVSQVTKVFQVYQDCRDPKETKGWGCQDHLDTKGFQGSLGLLVQEDCLVLVNLD